MSRNPLVVVWFERILRGIPVKQLSGDETPPLLKAPSQINDLLRGTGDNVKSHERKSNNRSVMPLDVLGRTRATMVVATRID